MPQRLHKSTFFTLIHPVTLLFDLRPQFSKTDFSNTVSSPNYLLPDFPIAIPYSRIRFSKKLANFYSKLIGPEGGFELDWNRANTAVDQHFLSPLRIPASNSRISNIASHYSVPYLGHRIFLGLVV